MGKDLKSLAGDLRRSPQPAALAPPRDAQPRYHRSRPGTGSSDVAPTAVPTGTGMPEADGTDASTDAETDRGPHPPPGTVPTQRSALEAADDAATALGERLRAPEVQTGPAGRPRACRRRWPRASTRSTGGSAATAVETTSGASSP